MKQIVSLILILSAWISSIPAQSSAIFDDTRVSKIFIHLPADSLQKMIDDLEGSYYYHASLIFDDGTIRDTLEQVGLRLRGNTSLFSQKKSFKVSFNEYEPGREYQGLRKLNLLGSHNDPTMIREKLFYHVWEKTGMPVRRTSFVELYINNEYRGLYTNAEEIDKQWLTRAFGNNDGNLFKCTYPADLKYLGNYTSIYKTILNNPETRAYDLVTNETEDDYLRLVELIRLLDQAPDAQYAANIQGILNVESVMMSFALDVATGNWDDYFYNKNNYYLYDNPSSGRFEFVTYDTDNSFGVDWLGKDWATRDALQWLPAAPQLRPLATKLLAIPAFYDLYVHDLDSITRFIVHPDTLFPVINHYHYLITASAAEDTYRSLDWGYDYADFHDGFTQTIDGHTPYGIKPFLERRHDKTMEQIAHLLSSNKSPDPQVLQMSVYPNPAVDRLTILAETGRPGELVYGTLVDIFGQTVQNWQSQSGSIPYTIILQDFPAGIYRVNLRTATTQTNSIILKAQ